MATVGLSQVGFLQKMVFRKTMEAADHENIDQLFPSFRELVDTMCGSSESGSVTIVLTQYVDFNSNIRKRFCSPGWSEEELDCLTFQSSKFRKTAAEVFGLSQAPNIKTSR